MKKKNVLILSKCGADGSWVRAADLKEWVRRTKNNKRSGVFMRNSLRKLIKLIEEAYETH